MVANPQMDVSFRDIAATSYLLRDRVVPTLCVRSQLTSYLKCKSLFLKLEYKQNGGSYKTRGAFNALMTIPREDRKKGIVVASNGNHGIALSFAGKKLGAPVTVVVPRLASASKVQTCRKYGANVIIEGEDLDDSLSIAREISKRENQKFIDIFSNFALGVGNATVGIELAQQAPKMDFCIIPYTMEKGILKGLQVAIKKMCPCCKIYAVRCASKNPSRLGLAGDPIVDRVIDISEDDILTAFLLLVEVEKVLVEPTSAMAIAALTSRKYPEFVDKNVVCFLGNGNVDLAAVTKLLARSSLIPMNSITFSVSLLDEIGSLQSLCAEISRNQVSIKDIVFPKNSSGDKMIVFCETTGPEHSKTFIRSMLAVYSDFQVIPLRAALKDQQLEARPFYMNDRRKDDHGENGLDSRHRSAHLSKDSTVGRGYSSQKAISGGIMSRGRSSDARQHSGSKRPTSCQMGRSHSNYRDSSQHHSQFSNAYRSQTQESNALPQHASPLGPSMECDDVPKGVSVDFDSRTKYDKRSKNRSQQRSDEYGDDSRDAMFGDNYEGGTVLTGEYEQTDHRKIYTVDRFDDNLTPLETMRVEEKRSVSKAVGRFGVGDKRHVGTIDKVLQSTTTSRQRPEPRFPQRPLRSRSRQDRSGDASKQSQSQDAAYPSYTYRTEEDNRSETDPGTRTHSHEKSGERMECKDESRSRGLKEDSTYSNKPDSSGTFDSNQYAPHQSEVGPWISVDTVDDQECRRSTITVSEHNLYDGERGQEQCPRESPKLKKCRIETCPFIDRQNRSRRSPTPDRDDLYCECGKKIIGCNRQTCPAYKSKDSQNTSKDSRLSKNSRIGSKESQNASKSSQNADRDHSKSKNMSGDLSDCSSHCCSSSSATSTGNVVKKQSTSSNRLDAGADDYHFLFHDGDYENCQCSRTMVRAEPMQSRFVRHFPNLFDSHFMSSMNKRTSYSDFEASLLKPMDFI